MDLLGSGAEPFGIAKFHVLNPNCIHWTIEHQPLALLEGIGKNDTKHTNIHNMMCIYIYIHIIYAIQCVLYIMYNNIYIATYIMIISYLDYICYRIVIAIIIA